MESWRMAARSLVASADRIRDAARSMREGGGAVLWDGAAAVAARAEADQIVTELMHLAGRYDEVAAACAGFSATLEQTQRAASIQVWR